MRIILILALLASAVYSRELPGAVLGSFANECEIPVESPVDIPAGPFEIPVETIIRFNIPTVTRMVHFHFAAPDSTPKGLTLMGFECTVIQKNDDGTSFVVNQILSPPDSESQHVAVKLPVFDASMAPVKEADDDGTIQGQIVVIYENGAGDEVRGEPQFYPEAQMNLCCPNSLTGPAAQIPVEEQISWDSNPDIDAQEIDGGDYFVWNAEGEVWAYFCHNGDFMSCFIIPDGFSDPTLNRFQAVGGVATFVDDSTGDEVEFVCVFREDGNAAGNDRAEELSGGFRRSDELVAAVNEIPDIPVPTTGMVKAECRVLMDNPFDIAHDPTSVNTDAAHIDGTQPFPWPADVTQEGLNVLKISNRLHADYDVEVPDDLSLSKFEITATQDGNTLSQVLVDPDPTDNNNWHIDVHLADPNGGLIETQVVAVFIDATGKELRSEAAKWPPSSLNCCPGNHPMPIQPDGLAHPDPDIDSTAEVDGGGRRVTTLDGKTYGYFCFDGEYMSCQVAPEGYDDPNLEKFQPVGAVSTFVHKITRVPTKFVCLLTSDPATMGDGFEASGHFFPLNQVFDVDVKVGAPGDVAAAPGDVAAAVDACDAANVAWAIIALILAGLLVASVAYNVHMRRNIPTLKLGSAFERIDEKEMASYIRPDPIL